MGKYKRRNKKKERGGPSSRDLYDQAAFLHQREEYQKAIKLYLEAYRIAVADPQSGNWYFIFCHFARAIKEKNRKGGYKDAKDDFKVLVKFSDSEAEPSVIRSQAAWAASILHLESRHTFQIVAELLRVSIEVCNSATDNEKRRIMFVGGGEMKPVGVILSKMKERLTEKLSEVTIAAGGDACDTCRKTLKELGLTHLSWCRRCRMVYYCSPECQSYHWKAGHKQECRKAGQIVEGDVMKTVGLVGRPEVNEKLVLIIAHDDTEPNRNNSDQWKVQMCTAGGDDGPTFSVSEDNLVHVRPLGPVVRSIDDKKKRNDSLSLL